MREILFRAKHIRALPQSKHLGGIWVYGYLSDENYINTIDEDEYGGKFTSEMLIDPSTVCQYTGLKDKNGKKVYENDIVKINDDVKETFRISDGVVVYRGGSFIIGDGNNGTLNSLFVIADINYALRGEVIGNIFDTPQLLKGVELE